MSLSRNKRHLRKKHKGGEHILDAAEPSVSLRPALKPRSIMTCGSYLGPDTILYFYLLQMMKCSGRGQPKICYLGILVILSCRPLENSNVRRGLL